VGAISQNPLKLLKEPGFYRGMEGEQIPCPGEGKSGGFVPGEQQGKHLVPELLVAHPAALHIPEAQQHGEEIPVIFTVPTPLPYEAVDHFVQPPDPLLLTRLSLLGP
jgi:hypothetical protein